MILYLLSSCLPFGYYKRNVYLKNCTGDTLIIGHSYFDAIDSVHCQLYPVYECIGDDFLDTTMVPIAQGLSLRNDRVVFPDSIFYVDSTYLFLRKDTCYFFLVKYKDLKYYSWKEIGAKKLYHKWIVVRGKSGNVDRNIRYPQK